jgi:hypothetical protein
VNLAARMTLDASGFIGPLAGAQNAISGAVKQIAALAGVALSIAAVFRGVKESLNMGGALLDLKNQTGAPIADLVVLRQVLKDASVGAESAGQILNLMQRSLAGVNEEGQPTVEMFTRLGFAAEKLEGQLSMAELKAMSPIDQIRAIGAAIADLKNPAEQTDAAMAIFGRSGGKLLSVFNDPTAFDVVIKSFGKMPDLLAKTSQSFADIDHAISRVKTKMRGFWAGFTAELSPQLSEVSAALDSIDFTSLGEKIGSALATGMQMIKDGTFGQALILTFQIAVGEYLNLMIAANKSLSSVNFWSGISKAIIAAFAGIGSALIQVFRQPLVFLQSAMESFIQNDIRRLMSGDWGFGVKVPGLGKFFGLEDFKPESFEEIFDRNNKNGIWIVDQAEESGRIAAEMFSEGASQIIDTFKSNYSDIFGTGELVNQLKEILSAAEDAKNRARDGIKEAVKVQGINTLAPPEKKAERGGVALTIPTDALARIGGFVGGSVNFGQDFARRTASATERTAKAVEKQLTVKQPARGLVAVWGV